MKNCVNVTVLLVGTFSFWCRHQDSSSERLSRDPVAAVRQSEKPTLDAGHVSPDAGGEFNLSGGGMLEIELAEENSEESYSPNPSVVPNCVKVLASDDVVGLAVCDSDPGKTAEIKAGHGRQVCIGGLVKDSDKSLVETLKGLKGCQGVSFLQHEFKPSIRITFAESKNP